MRIDFSEMDTINSQHFNRFALQDVERALSGNPVTVLHGPRGVGKSSLISGIGQSARKYVSLEDDSVRDEALYDPMGFVRGLDRVTIDEVQRAPDLLLAIKNSVEEDPRPGRFLLTSSCDLLPQLPESLAGRMEIVTLLPLSKGEIEGRRPRFLAETLRGSVVEPNGCRIGGELIQTLLAGGYPEMLQRDDPRQRRWWARGHVKGLLERDARDVANLDKSALLDRLIQLHAAHSGELTNFAEMGKELGIDDKTTRKYSGVLERLMLLERIPAWFQDGQGRLVKTPKLHFLDSGLLAALLGLTGEKVAKDRRAFARLLGAFVSSEILKQATLSDTAYTISHYGDKDRDKVDFVVEEEGGALAGIEIKPGATVFARDFKGLRKLENAAGDRLKLGVVLYDGTRVVPFGERLFAAPFSCLWS